MSNALATVRCTTTECPSDGSLVLKFELMDVAAINKESTSGEEEEVSTTEREYVDDVRAEDIAPGGGTPPITPPFIVTYDQDGRLKSIAQPVGVSDEFANIIGQVR